MTRGTGRLHIRRSRTGRPSFGSTAPGTRIRPPAPASASVSNNARNITLGKSVDKAFIGTLPNALTYTLSPRSDNAEPLENVWVIDPYPAGRRPRPPRSASVARMARMPRSRRYRARQDRLR